MIHHTCWNIFYHHQLYRRWNRLHQNNKPADFGYHVSRGMGSRIDHWWDDAVPIERVCIIPGERVCPLVLYMCR